MLSRECSDPRVHDSVGAAPMERRGDVTSESNEPAHADTSARSAGPKGALLIALAVVTGVAAGIGGFTFRYAEGLSYFSKTPWPA